MKRRSRSSPPQNKRIVAEPGTPGPFTADLARDQRQQNFPGASPTSAKKTAAFRQLLFGGSMVRTRTKNATTMDSSTSDSSGPAPIPEHETPPSNIIVDEMPRAPRQQQPERDPPGPARCCDPTNRDPRGNFGGAPGTTSCARPGRQCSRNHLLTRILTGLAWSYRWRRLLQFLGTAKFRGWLPPSLPGSQHWPGAISMKPDSCCRSSLSGLIWKTRSGFGHSRG